MHIYNLIADIYRIAKKYKNFFPSASISIKVNLMQGKCILEYGLTLSFLFFGQG